MLKKEQNDLVTQTGPGTPMGEVFRRYWLPALLSEQLPTPDCDPVRLELLSEKMLAFRDTEGRLGLVDEFCAHRGVSLWFGRNEEGASAVLTMAGNTMSQDSAPKCPQSPTAATVIASSSSPIPWSSVVA